MNTRRFCLVLLIALVTGVSVPVRAQISFGKLTDKLKQGVDVVTKAPQPGQPTTGPAAPAAQPSAPAAAAGQSAPAQAQNQRESSYICSDSYSDRQTSRTTFYRTGVFQAAASLQTISDAWDRYVIKTDHLPDEAGPNCGRAPSDPAGQQYTQTYMDQSAQAHKAVIVHVDWKYTLDQATAPVAQAAPAATAAQPPATAAAGQGTLPVGLVANYYCFAYFDQNSQNNYASSVSTVPMRGDTVIMANDFAKFVKEKYQSGERGEKVTGTCYNATIDKAVRAGLENLDGGIIGVSACRRPRWLPNRRETMSRRPRRNHTPAFKILWGVDSDRRSGRVRLFNHPLWRRPCRL